MQEPFSLPLQTVNSAFQTRVNMEVALILEEGTSASVGRVILESTANVSSNVQIYHV